MKKTILLLCITVLSILGITSCSNYGNKINIEGTKGEVYYKDGATESQAQKVGDFLKQDGFFGNQKSASVQVAKNGDNYVVRFVYNKDYYEKTPGLEEFFKNYGVRMSNDLFNGKKIDITLADKYFKDFKTIPYEATTTEPPAPPITSHDEVFNKADYNHQTVGDVNFYWKGLTNVESKPIIDYIVKNGAFSGGTAEIYITKDDGHYILKFPVKEEYRNDNNIITEVEKVSKEIKDNVFPNDPYSFQMTDERLSTIRTFDY